MKHRSSFADEPEMRDLLAAFIVHLAENVRELRALVEADDAEGVRRVAHQLKGAGKSYGFAPISAYAGAVEQIIAATRDLEPALAELDSLLAYIENVEGYTPR